MQNQKLNNKGFTHIGIVLLVLVFVVLGAIGAYVYHADHKTKTVTTSSSGSTQTTPPLTTTPTAPTPKPDPYAGWNTYANGQVSFKFPSGWKASMGRGQSRVADATSPAFASGAVATVRNPGAPINIYLRLDTDKYTIDCASTTCQVVAVLPLNNVHLPSSVLAVVNQTSNNGTKFTEWVVANANTKVGDTSVTAVKSGNGGAYVFGQAYYTPKTDPLTEAAKVTNLTSFQANSIFKDLVSLINSIKFN